MWRVAVLVGVVVSLGTLALSMQPAFSDQVNMACHQTAPIEVRISPDSSQTIHVAGWFCGNQNTRHANEVEFLAHGASYDHSYWLGFGYNSVSYAHAAAMFGHETFMIDMPGAGQSDHPDPSLVTFRNNAYVLSQIVSYLRNGRLGHYRKVIGVGHSMGAGAWLIEAGIYKNVDGVIITDETHDTDPAGVARITKLFAPYPGLPSGYLTTNDRTFFYNMSNADPRVVAADKPESFSLGQIRSLPDARDPQYSKAIRVPVLLVVGERDALDCGPQLSCANADAIKQREQKDFTVSVSTFVLPDSGHDTALHKNSRMFFIYANWWLRNKVR